MQPAVASPIADLTYRDYQGPLRTHAVRWWIVAVATLRMAARKPAFWAMVAICLLPYLAHGLRFYLQNNAAALTAGNNPFASATPSGQRWAFLIFQCLNGNVNSFGLFLIALIIGSGSISADNRANALLVYLSKPITKGDYLLGKWMGIFLTLYAVALIPALLIWSFLALSYSSEGFFKDDPWLLPHLILAAAIPAAIHSSLILGFSAWSKSPSIAGANYAGLYFLGNLIVGSILGHVVMRDSPKLGNLVQHLAIEGTIDGIAQNILRVTDVEGLRGFAINPMQVGPPPNLWPILAMGAALVVLGIGAARMKIRAVEVIRG
jgi:ABC-2 type transport system permease protein